MTSLSPAAAAATAVAFLVLLASTDFCDADTISEVWVATGTCENCGMNKLGQLSIKVRFPPESSETSILNSTVRVQHIILRILSCENAHFLGSNGALKKDSFSTDRARPI